MLRDGGSGGHRELHPPAGYPQGGYKPLRQGGEESGFHANPFGDQPAQEKQQMEGHPVEEGRLSYAINREELMEYGAKGNAYNLGRPYSARGAGPQSQPDPLHLRHNEGEGAPRRGRLSGWLRDDAHYPRGAESSRDKS